MRLMFLAFPLLVATPAVAQPIPAPVIPPVLTDPAMADQLGRVAGAVTRSLMNLPVGELEAAIENRPVDPAATARARSAIRSAIPTSSSASRRRPRSRAARCRPRARRIATSLPAIMQAIEGAQRRDRARRRQHAQPDVSAPLIFRVRAMD